MDVLTPEQRHRNMSNIHSSDTSVELMLRKALWHKGYRYRKNWKALPGKPDIVITKYKIAIFVDSEFFHGKDWDISLRDRTRRGNNPEFWEKKITRNIERDLEVSAQLNGLGWKVLRFWDKEVKKNLEGCLNAVDEAVQDSVLDL